MPFNFTCPHCLHKTLVDESVAGHEGPCVSCGKRVTVLEAPKRASQAGNIDAGSAVRPAARSVAKQTQQRWKRTAVKTAIFSLGSLAILIVGLSVLGPKIVQLKEYRDIAACKQNLRRIAQALNNYAKDYGTYPPAVTRNSAGVPMHSWRILILPYLGEEALYKQYDLEQPWNSSENSSMQWQVPAVFVSPASVNRGVVGESNYMLIRGPRTLFPPAGSWSPGGIRDGAANTLLVVETNNTLITWTDPTDLEFAVLPAQFGSGGVGGTHPGGATVVFADGQPGWLPSDTSKSVLDSLVTPAGGEAVLGSWFY